ncbi:hypothetical protein AQUCO_00300522v1 [Aquilegia coerulea]|uniref:Peptidyl-prolyl cis-trans isomerase n=2 Tax=Aquilegia coerulea TaxID=218851 RepID=A0A2G5EZI4_AQUCA|nr:hypothetical protein AQUCO_00300522v1 [Aquilegia coerulea]
MGRMKPQTLLLQSKKKKGPTRIISVTTIVFGSLILLLFVLSLFTTYRYWSQRSRNLSGNNDLEDFDEDGEKFDRPVYAILDTSKGSIVVELFKEASPEIMDKFFHLCKTGYFKGMLFHRVVKNFMAQAGNSQRVEAAEDWMLDMKPQNELMSTKHEAFMLGTSKDIHANKGFDLFITTAPIPDLNDKLVVFGQVIKGEDVVQEIEEVDTDKLYRPKSPIGIVNISLRRQR